jgi:hypothetical protein
MTMIELDDARLSTPFDDDDVKETALSVIKLRILNRSKKAVYDDSMESQKYIIQKDEPVYLRLLDGVQLQDYYLVLFVICAIIYESKFQYFIPTIG